MLNVFICEDNLMHKDQIEKAIEKCIMIYDLDVKLALSSVNPDDIIEYLKERRSAGLYFLDLHLNHSLNGMELANIIRKYDPRGFIVFISTDSESKHLTFEYKVEAIDYIVKELFSNLEEKIYSCILNAYEKYKAKVINDLQKNFSFNTFNKTVVLEYPKIYYFETSPNSIHKIRVHTTDGKFEFYSSLDKVMKDLDKRFFRCHNSFIINTQHVLRLDISKKVVYFNQGDSCFVASRRLKALAKLLQNIGHETSQNDN